MNVPSGSGCMSRLSAPLALRGGDQSVNNRSRTPGTTGAIERHNRDVVNNRRTIFSRIPGIKRVPVRATDTKHPRAQRPASTC